MISAGTLQQRFLPTQIVGAAIQASMYFLPVAKGTILLASAAGFDWVAGSSQSVLVVACACWILVFLQSLLQRPPRWPKISRILADPTISIPGKIIAVFKNWLSLLIIISMLVWVVGSTINGIPILR
jgi:hypothetical protein